MATAPEKKSGRAREEGSSVAEENVATSAEQVTVGGAPPKDRFLPISILIAAVLVGGSVLFAAFYRGGNGAAANNGAGLGGTPTPAQGPSASTTAAIMQLGSRDAVLGNANAPVTLIEYGDYQCPFCGEFFSQTEPSIVSTYVNAGKVKMIFRNFAFLGPESAAAAEAAECAVDQNKFWAYHNALYAAKVGDDQKGGSENDGFFTRALFISLAQQNGLNVSEFTSCIDNNRYATTVTSERATASSLGIDSTPYFFVNGTPVVGAEPFSTFQQAINAALNA